MKKHYLSIFLVLMIGLKANSQGVSSSKVTVSSAAYDELKASGKLQKGVDYSIQNNKHTVSSSKVTKEQWKKLKSNRDGEGGLLCSCVAAIDTTFNVAEFTDGTPPEYRSDDGSTAAKSIPFNFCLYGTNYTQFFINNNGNVTLNGAYGAYTSTGFPFQGQVMLAPFWADVNTNLAASGLVYYKITPSHVIVQWNQVAYYGMTGTPKLNTFQVIFTDGVDSILPTGSNIAFCYGNMQWTTGSGGTNGFGGSPATVGINKGDGVNYIQFGTFDQPGIAYDGGTGLNDGVDFLDNQSFYSDFCTGSNMAPVASGLLNCDTVKICGSGDTLYLRETFLSPEPGQNTNISVNMNGMSNATVISNTSGNTASVVIRIISSAANAGVNPITFVATDDGTPIGSTVITANVLVDIAATANMNPVITGLLGFCPGDSTILSVQPTTYNNYVWSTVTSGTSTVASTSGIYFVTSELNGCSKSATVNVFEHPNPTPSIGGFPYTCHGSGFTTVLYSDSLIYSAYHWSNTSSNDSIIVGNGTYTLTVTDSYGCIDSATIAVVPIAALPVPVTVSGSTATANITNVTYQWIDCNNGNAAIAGATNQSYTPWVNGSFAAVISNGFCYDTSACITLTAGINESDFNNSITVSPNPFSSQTTISFSEIQQNTVVKIIDVVGQEIRKVNVSGTKNVVMERGDLSKGIYFLQIEKGSTVINRKIMIQ